MKLYEALGMKTIINGLGTVTAIGGSKMHPEVLSAMNEAAGAFVDMGIFHARAGDRIAELLGGEAACITSGAAAGLAIAAAACMTRGDIGKTLQLPDTTGMPNEILLLKCHRILYDQALLLSGAKLREIGVTSSAKLEQIEAAISEKTAMFFYAAEAERMRGSIALPEIVQVLTKYSIPIVVDAAAELPPKSNVTKYLEQGADLVIFSGGKELRGPQSSGIILGSKQLIEYCKANNYPNYSIGRSMKLDKETIAGITKAVELFVAKDYIKIMERWERMVSQMITAFSHISGTTVRRGFPVEPGVQPVEIPRVYMKSVNVSAKYLQDQLKSLTPSIYVDVQGEEIVINPQCLEDDEVSIVIEAIRNLFVGRL
ncbi:aminotransferase class V-fold PLP-dependent enzyme [Cohnella silvisoli]|uniref:Aminotransferase class V-fold PLP-dependent enzyme n=1 Tax=Cohnella silvisoli TaxID=2873699 RepID=A0ABV1L0K5_9BACL|nr:aminotransferase class V-fold PLP-dependent enzyme [Cohnella silvisoli]MCD9025141.1 aminotransferase class V-fold PLP-dependent enzyme [Cohnella silvisoli]